MKFALTYGILPIELRPHEDPTTQTTPYGGIAPARWKTLRDEILAELSAVFVVPIATTTDPNRWDALNAADWRLMDSFRPGNDWDALELRKVGSSTLGKLFDCEDAVNSEAMVVPISGAQVAAPCGFAASFALLVAGSQSFNCDLADLENFMYQDSTYELENGEYWLLHSLKNGFQRPRPFQIAYDLSYPEFLVKMSPSAQSAALPSGHCMQGLLNAITADNRIPSTSIWHKHKNELPVWAAGVADRRVYAGLHYPSDNLASWIAVGHMIAAIFSGDVAARNRALDVAKKSISASICWTATRQDREFDKARIALIRLFEGLS